MMIFKEQELLQHQQYIRLLKQYLLEWERKYKLVIKDMSYLVQEQEQLV